MGPSIVTAEPAPLMRSSSNGAPRSRREPNLFEPVGPPVPWTRTTYAALIALVVLWGAQVYFTWADWGNLTIDCGHEMYVPALLAQGKVLYRDVWFQFGPAAPYFNSYLFRLFGINLSVLYWAGALSALGSALFLYLAGMQLSSWLIGATAGAVVIVEGFQPSAFCFPLPYSFSAVYGCLVGCVFLWLVINAARSNAWGWMFGAGTAAALALLLKPEYGMACYCTLALFIVARFMSAHNWRSTLRDIAAAVPGAVLCGAVILWMVSLRGVAFITQENIQSWPTSYFMKVYGKRWLSHTGFSLNFHTFHDALIHSLPVATALTMVYACLRWNRSTLRATLLKVLLVLLVMLFFSLPVFLVTAQAIEFSLRSIIFPGDMVLYIVIGAGAAWLWWCWRSKDPGVAPDLRIPLLLFFSGLLAFRILTKNSPWGYPIYYNGPVGLSFLLLTRRVIPHRNRSRRFVFIGEAIICVACVIGVAINPLQAEAAASRDFVPLTTERGTIRVSKHMEENYAAAIQFMRQKAALGESVLSVPEDTSLYFLSETICPTRVFLFTPGVLVPGKMTDETIHKIDEKKVAYLLWSDRRFPSYGVPVFGRDFDRVLGNYLTSHYHLARPLTHLAVRRGDWTADIWARDR